MFPYLVLIPLPTACMHVLRSTYLPLFSSLIRSPYTSDPFPHTAPGAASYSSSSVPSPPGDAQREMRVLDLFIVLKVREDVWADESELHLERDESFRDLFDLNQPRARVEDLVGAYGAREGVVALSSSSSSPSSTSSSSSFSSSSSYSSSPTEYCRRLRFEGGGEYGVYLLRASGVKGDTSTSGTILALFALFLVLREECPSES